MHSSRLHIVTSSCELTHEYVSLSFPFTVRPFSRFNAFSPASRPTSLPPRRPLSIFSCLISFVGFCPYPTFRLILFFRFSRPHLIYVHAGCPSSCIFFAQMRAKPTGRSNSIVLLGMQHKHDEPVNSFSCDSHTCDACGAELFSDRRIQGGEKNADCFEWRLQIDFMCYIK